jgi:GH15 family glucan-1,4-alpha-glucosidase
MAYPPIADHGLIGDLQTAALVSTDGTIDFFCCPRFDSPSVFASLLDDRKGGRFAVSPTGEFVTKQMYLPDSAVLVTRFLSEGGVAELVDFMPIENPGIVTDRHRVVRSIRGVRGKVDFEVRVEPRFDYGRQTHRTTVRDRHARFESDALDLDLVSTWALERHGDDVRAHFTVEAGDFGALVLESGADGHPRGVDGDEVGQLLLETTNFWRAWVERGTYRGRWREAVYRSAITLKLMTYAPTGALVAAPTGGLPEQVGGERNWDYRYTWIRDGSFSVYALLGLGFFDEAAAFGTWIRKRIEERRADGGAPLNIMYRVDGSSDLDEYTLDHFEGYRGSSPVRIGNGAADQLQLDIYGEAMDSIYFIDQGPYGPGDAGWSDIVGMLDWLCENWDQPDEGIWETRGGRKPFVYGRLMSWVALDRAIRMATKRGRPADLPRWVGERDRIYQAIMERGWNPDLQAFAQFEGSDVLDASNLLMPLVGFIVPNDPKWQSTLSAMDRTLVSDSLVYRYDPKASPDGLRGSEGTFSLCTFWYVDALARSGRLDDARLVFEKMLTYANHVGLFSEEIGATGEQLGNFPQAFTHLSLINAAINLDYQLDHGAGRITIETGPPSAR